MTAMPNEFSPILGERGANPFLESLYEFRIWTAPKIKGIEGGTKFRPPFAVNDKHRQIGGIEYHRHFGATRSISPGSSFLPSVAK